jgi:urease accessory protein
MQPDWLIWQLADSAFPAGAFAHSSGLEAAWQLGEIASAQDLSDWISTSLQQTGQASIPAVAAAWEGSPSLREVDAFCESFLLNHVANRASRAQGRALLMACDRTFDVEAVRRVAGTVRTEGLAGHFAPVVGALGRALDLPRRRACELFLFMALRGAVSSAVRLGIVGPLQGQGLQHKVGRVAAEIVERCVDIPLEQVAQTAPLADLIQGTHDRLYSRLFVS